TLTSATIGAATSNEFTIASGPAFPYALAVGQQIAFSVSYAPVDDGDDTAALFVNAGQGGLNVAGLTGRGVSKPDQTDRFVQDSQSKVDLLFVIDNSGSMMEEQTSMSTNFASILTEAQNAGVD